MLAFFKRHLFPISIAIVIVIMIWQYRASGANANPAESVLRNSVIEIRIQTADSPSPPMQEHSFIVQVKDSEGRSINDAKIRMTIKMPRMFCGEFPVEVASQGSGQFEARVVPVMSGQWEAETIVESRGRTYKINHRFLVES